MPSVSEKQERFMRAVSHSPKFAKKVGVPQSVGEDFEAADKKKAKRGLYDHPSSKSMKHG